MTSVGSNFLCGRPPGGAPSPVRTRPPEPDTPTCGRHKWMAPDLIQLDKNAKESLNLSSKDAGPQ